MCSEVSTGARASAHRTVSLSLCVSRKILRFFSALILKAHMFDSLWPAPFRVLPHVWGHALPWNLFRDEVQLFTCDDITHPSVCTPSTTGLTSMPTPVCSVCLFPQLWWFYWVLTMPFIVWFISWVIDIHWISYVGYAGFNDRYEHRYDVKGNGIRSRLKLLLLSSTKLRRRRGA